MRRTPLRRLTPLRAMSAKRRRELPERAKVRQAVLERDAHACRRCGAPASQVHELRQRSLGGNWLDPEGCITLCSPCHAEVHDFVAASYQEGWLR